MRLTLMVLSILRALPMVRTAFISLGLAVFVAASSTCAPALRSRTHRKATTSQASHHRPHAATARRTASHAVHRTTRSYSSHRRIYRREATAVSARMPIHHYAWMSAASSEASSEKSVPVVHPSEAESPEAPAATSTPVGTTEEDEAADAPAAEVPSAQEAAKKIAATETQDATPAPSRELSASVASIPASPLRSAGRNSSIVAMAPLRGSLESLVRQNEKTDADNLERIEDDADLHNRIASGTLVPVPASDALIVNSNLPQDRRYCRPWTAKFLKDLASSHQAQFHHPFEVSSAVRTVAYQKQLMRVNGNAAPAEGDIASPHLTGATIDIAKSGLGRSEIFWMRDRLNALQNEGKIDVEEEFHQACFHITVYKSYVGAGPLHKPRKHVPAPKPSDGTDEPAVASDAPATGQ
jgi:hypothetical protein